MSIHQRIRERRQQLGITSLEKLAEHIHTETGKRFAWQTVQLWEKEGGTAPNRTNAPFVAKALRCSVEWLNTGQGTPDDPPNLPTEPVSPDLPLVERMTLQYTTPQENVLLELFRNSYEAGRNDIIEFSRTTTKQPLELITRTNQPKV